jgi:hypothetical protein
MRYIMLIAGCLIASLCFADLTIVQTEAGYDNQNATSTTYMRGGQTATRDSVSGIILDFDKKTIVLLDIQDRSFCRASLSDYRKQAVQFATETHAQLREQAIQQMMAYGNTRAQADSVLIALQAMNKPDSSLFLPVETIRGETKTIVGFSADAYLLKQNGAPVRLVWISDQLQKRVDREIDPARAIEVKEEMKRIEEEMMSVFTSGVPQAAPTIDSVQTELERKGYLMATLVALEDGTLGAQDEITEIRETPIDPALFQIPTGFREVSIIDIFRSQYAHSEQ